MGEGYTPPPSAGGGGGAAGGFAKLGQHTYATYSPNLATSSSNTGSANDGRYSRIVIGETGHLRDVSFLVNTTGGNAKILVLDTGQANATHTTLTCLAISGSIATPAAGAWVTYDPNLAVTAGDTLVFVLTFDGTVAKFAQLGAPTGGNLLPTTDFLLSSGAGTTSQKLAGGIAAANMPTTSSGAGSTVTDANLNTSVVAMPLWVWRIS